MIRTIRMDDPGARQALAGLRRPLLLEQLLQDSPELQSVHAIIDDVRARGDAAVADVTQRVDNVALSPGSFRVPAEALAAAQEQLDPALRAAMRKAIDQVRTFQEHILTTTREPLRRPKVALQARLRPMRRVGVCVPGAAAPLPSSAIHCAVPAQVAGVKDVVLVAPPRHQGTVHPTILGVAAELGITEVYRVGGPQAVAALAIGTESIPRVDKIVGPGGIYTQLAKRLCYGMVDIEMFAGPSEVVVIADEAASAVHVAADLLSQAEHDPGAAILLTPSAMLLEAVRKELAVQLVKLSRQEGTARSLDHYSALVLVRNLDEAVELANGIAPEHLEIDVRDAEALVDRIENAGAIFVGAHGTEAAGDYVAGPSHVLPTGGSARFWSGLSCNDFLRRTSILRYEPGGLDADADAIIAIAEAEGLTAHANSVRVRQSK
ncbi:MAG: histidinol dehydrogenase [Phycisphaerae bacterium]|nr:histidinol dehydrogenase [Phycisphaerae bacterium]